MGAIIGTVVVLAIVIGVAVLISHESKRVRQQKGLPPPEGFRGWLLLLAIVETIRPAGTIRVSAEMWRLLPSWEAKFVLALLFSLLLLELFTIVAMYRRRRYFRFAYLAQSAFTLVVTGLDALGTPWNAVDSERLAYQHGQIIGSATMAIVWTIYVFRSERVRNTFIQPRPAAADIVKVF